jgi:battenin
MPFVIPIVYFFLLPRPEVFLSSSSPLYEDTLYADVGAPLPVVPYTALASVEDRDGEEEGSFAPGPKQDVSLSMSNKWRLVRPLLFKYMLPLCE